MGDKKLVIEGFSFGNCSKVEEDKTESILQETQTKDIEFISETNPLTLEQEKEDVSIDDEVILEELRKVNENKNQINLSDLIITSIEGVGVLEPAVIFVKAIGHENKIGIPGFINHQNGEFVLLENGAPCPSHNFKELFKEFLEKAQNGRG
jgi:hypothetical protein